MKLLYFKTVNKFCRHQRGIFTILTAGMAVVLFLLIGWALDSGNLFHARHRLQRAVDAAAISGITLTRRIPDDLTTVEEKVHEMVKVNAALHNVPLDELEIEVPTLSVTEIAVRATYPRDLLLIPPFYGAKRNGVTARARAKRGSVAMIMVVDLSGSMTGEWGDGSETKITSLKRSAIRLVSMFNASYDQLAIIGYSDAAWVIKDIDEEVDIDGLTDIINKDLVAIGATNLADALDHAFMQAMRIEDEPELRKIVMVLSDGQPNMTRLRLAVPENLPENQTMFGTHDYFYDPYADVNRHKDRFSLIKAPPDIPLGQGVVMGCITPGGCLSGALPNDTAVPSNLEFYDFRATDSISYQFERPPNWTSAIDLGARAAIISSDNLRRELNMAVYSIGIGDTEGTIEKNIVLERLLKRIANDAQAGMNDPPYGACEGTLLCDPIAHYDQEDLPSLPIGKYFYAGDPAQLQAIFDDIENTIFGYRLVE